jgi:hypothetical protein
MRALFFSGAVVLGMPVALAQDSFIGLDRNRDGAISRIEALADAEIQKRFASFDADGDGLLSRREYRQAAQDNSRRMLRDSAISERVRQALIADKAIPAGRIAVETYEGRVHLTGFVGAPGIASRAGRLTAAVEGVRTVRNDIVVK